MVLSETSRYGRTLHGFRATEHRPPAGPPKLWSDHATRVPLELPLWGLSARQIAAAARLPTEASYRMARVSMVVAATHNLCLTIDPFGLEVHLANLDSDMRGFAVEGVGMGLFTREAAGEPPAALDAFLSGTGARFSGLAYTGVGLAHVHLRRPFDPGLLDRWSGLGRWMVLDGLGFWAGKVDWERYGIAREVWPGVESGHRRLFDRGLGRSGWFENGTRIDQVADWVLNFPENRQHDIALGVGVASTFTGGVEQSDLEVLRERLREFGADLAAGSINACETRYAACIDTPYTERAAQALAGRSVRDAYDIAQSARGGLAGDSYSDALVWYDRLRAAARD